VLTLGGGIVFTPIATALTVVALRRTRPETLVDFGALLVGGGGGRLLHAYVRVDCWASPVRGAALSLAPEVASESRLGER
jgi:hypothetical protein